MSEPSPASRTNRVDDIVDDFVARYHSASPLRAEDLVDAHGDIAELLAERLAAAESLLTSDDPNQRTRSGERRPDGRTEVQNQCENLPPMETLSLPGYRIICEIHRGGQGIVYQATQESTTRKVAIKLLLGGAFASAATKKRFMREVEIVARLRHPGIITIFDSGVTPDRAHYYVMDYVDGLPLNRYVRKAGANFNQVVELFLSVCDAVAHAHQNGVIHRDLKPQNILVDNTGCIKVLDFGLAKSAEQQHGGTVVSTTGQVFGTLPYMSPEQARGESDLIDTRTDVYALGVILYELLSGVFPYDVEGSASDIIQNIAEATPQPLRRAWRENVGVSMQPLRRTLRRNQCPLDDEIQTVVFKAIAKEPQRRYQSVAALADDLRRYLAGDPIEAKRDSRLYVLRKTLSRNKLAVSIVAAGMILITVFGLAMTALYTQAKYHQGVAEQRELVARKHLYAAEMKLAQQAWQEARLDRVDDLLRRHIPAPGLEDLRHFEWYYLEQMCELDDWTGRGHDDTVYDAVFAPDGKTIVSGDLGGKLCVWDASTGDLLKQVHWENSAIWSLAYSPDGRLVAAGGNGVAIVWDAATWTTLYTLEGHENVILDLTFAPDGNLLATASSDNTAKLWDIKTGTLQETLQGHERFVSSVAFTPDGITLATGSSDSLIKLWNVPSGELLADLISHERGVYSLAFSQDGTRLASAGGHWHLAGELKLWDLDHNEPIAETNGHKYGIWSVEFSPDGTQLVTASEDQTVKLWSVPTLTELGKIRGHTGFVYVARFAPDGKTVASSSSDKTVRLWAMEDFDVPLTLSTEGAEVVSIRLSPNGESIIAACDDGTVRYWSTTNAHEGRTLHTHDKPVRAVAFSTEGQRLFSADNGTIATINAATGRIMSTAPVKSLLSDSFAISPSGKQLAVGNSNGVVDLWDVTTGESIARWQAHDSVIGALSFSPDSHMLATAGDDQAVKLWSVASSSLLMTLGPVAKQAGAIVFSPDGSLVATGGVDHVVNVWVVETGHPVRTFIGHGDRITSLAFTPDKKTLAVGAGHRDPTIRLWDLETGLERATLRAHGRAISGVAFTPDGMTMITGSADMTVKIWRATQTPVSSAAFPIAP